MLAPLPCPVTCWEQSRQRVVLSGSIVFLITHWPHPFSSFCWSVFLFQISACWSSQTFLFLFLYILTKFPENVRALNIIYILMISKFISPAQTLPLSFALTHTAAWMSHRHPKVIKYKMEPNHNSMLYIISIYFYLFLLYLNICFNKDRDFLCCIMFYPQE